MRLSTMGLAILLACLAGCRSEPFAPEAMPPLTNPDPAALRAAFASRLPQRFISDDTVVIYSPFQDMAVLGVLRVDRTKGTFELLGLNHMGVQLFMLAGDADHTEIRFAIGPLAGKKDVLTSIAQDVRNMYFDLTPAAGALSKVYSNYVRFEDQQPQGSAVYKFGGAGLVLLEKRRPSWMGSVWKVRYFQYTAAEGGLFPHGIVLDNYRYYYRIVVKNRFWQVE